MSLRELEQWAGLHEPEETDWHRGYEAARAYCAMQLAAEPDERLIAASIRYRRTDGPLRDVKTSVWINGVCVPGCVSVCAYPGVHRAYRLELEIAADELVSVDLDSGKITRAPA